MKFRIDIKIFIFLILFYFTRQIEIYAMIMIFALIHELGHLLAGVLLGMKPEKIEIMPFGVSISFRINTKDYIRKIKNANMLEIKKIIVAMAGPVTNIILILIACNLKINLIKSLIIIYTNILILVFNLLPIFPLDGGRILKGIIHIKRGKRVAEKHINSISMITTIIITALISITIMYMKNISIFLIDIYLWFLVIKENVIYNKKLELYNKTENILENKI